MPKHSTGSNYCASVIMSGVIMIALALLVSVVIGVHGRMAIQQALDVRASGEGPPWVNEYPNRDWEGHRVGFTSISAFYGASVFVLVAAFTLARCNRTTLVVTIGLSLVFYAGFILMLNLAVAYWGIPVLNQSIGSGGWMSLRPKLGLPPFGVITREQQQPELWIYVALLYTVAAMLPSALGYLLGRMASCDATK